MLSNASAELLFMILVHLVNLGTKLNKIDHNMTGVNDLKILRLPLISIIYLVTVPIFIKFEGAFLGLK